MTDSRSKLDRTENIVARCAPLVCDRCLSSVVFLVDVTAWTPWALLRQWWCSQCVCESALVNVEQRVDNLEGA